MNGLNSYTFSNGFKVIFAANNAHPVVSLQLFVRMGSCWETDEEAGFSHFTEHLVFKSTKKFPKNSLSDKAMYLGSAINAYTEFDSTCFYITLSSQFLYDGLEIIAELARNADFGKKDFNFEKKVVLEELNQYENDPEDNFIEQIPTLYFPQSSYRKPIIGNRDSLHKASLEDLKKFYHDYYTPDNCYLVVSGDIDPKEAVTLIGDLFGDWTGKKSKELTAPPSLYPDKLTFGSIKRKVSKDLLAFVIPEISALNQKSYPLNIVTSVFAVGSQSRLHKRLYIKEKLVEQIKVESFTGINDGITLIIVIPNREKDIDKIIDIFFDEFVLLRQFGLTEEEIDKTKKEMIHSHRHSMESAKGLAMNLGVEELLGGYEQFFSYQKMIQDINEKQIAEVTQECIVIDKIGVFKLGKEFDGSIFKKYEKILPETIIRTGITADYYEELLDCNAKLVMKKVRGRPTIGITAAFKVSQLNETAEERGINLLTSTLLLYGNDKRTYDQLITYCANLGIKLSISASEELTLIKIKCFNEQLKIALDILSDVVLTPTFPNNHLNNILTSLISSLERIKDYPTYYAGHLLKNQMFGRISNLSDREGTKTTLKKINRKKIFNWYKKYYTLSNMTLAVVGDYDFNETISYCNRILSAEKSIIKSINIVADPQVIYQPGKRFKRTGLDNNQQAIVQAGGFACNSLQTKENSAFHLLALIMGGDLSSRLNESLREKSGLAYSVGFEYKSLKQLGFFAAYALVDRAYEKESLKLMLNDFAVMIKDGVTEKELTVAKNCLRGQRLRAEESVLGQSISLAVLEALGFGYDYYLKREERLNKITISDINETAAEYLRREALFINILV